MRCLRIAALNAGLLVVLVVGCSRKEASKTIVPPPPQAAAKPADAATDAAPPPPPEAIAPASAGAAQSDVPSPVDPDLVRFVQGKVESFLNGQGRNPTSLEELIQYKYLTAIPAAPPGKKFILDKATSSIKLVNQ